MGNSPNGCGRPGVDLWVEDEFRWNQGFVRRSSCAHPGAGHRTSPTPSGNGERDSSETRVRTTHTGSPGCGAAAGWRGRWDRVSKGCRPEASPVPVTLKGPCDSYSRGPFTHFRPGCGTPGSRSAAGLSAVGIGAFSVDEARSVVDERPLFGGTRRMFREPLARRFRPGVELLPRPPETGSGTARRRGSVRRDHQLAGGPAAEAG